MKITVDGFLSDLADILQTDAELALNTELETLEEWDSLATMSLIAYFDKKFALRISFDEISKCKEVADIIALSDGNIA